jgi:TonB-dependent starch-binding outer membrane protein SusC
MKTNSSKCSILTVFSMMLAFMLASVPVVQAQEQTVTGSVTDLETRETLPGVNIVVKGTTIGTATNPDGEFSLSVPSASDTLVFSYLGFQSVEIPLNGRSTLSVGLAPQVFSGEELIVIGYGTVTKRDLTGSVTSIDPAKLSQVPATNVMESLQGKVPGLDITRSSGEAGSGVNLTLRGTRSLTASNNPLIIVDGVQYGNIQDINPADISSIDVLKDASSTAIYGSRGANGVILITTKQGPRTSGTQVSINTYTGISQVASYPAFNTGPQYVTQKERQTVQPDHGTVPPMTRLSFLLKKSVTSRAVSGPISGIFL